MCLCGGVKNRIVTCEKCMFWCEKGYKWIGTLGSYISHYSHNLNWPQISDHPHRYGTLTIGGSGSGKTNALLNLITYQLT